MASKPSVLIFGGLNTVSRTMASLLVPLEGESLVSHLRIVDKFSVHPATTYIGPEFPKILEKAEVEYKQANLTLEASIPPLFDPPNGIESFSYVFDFTGETRQDRTETIQINMTCNVSRLLGEEAARRQVKAFVRHQHPYYETSAKSIPNEKVDIKPYSVIGNVWHETLRVLATIPNLNLVIVRSGFMYGPYIDFGPFPAALAVASVYAYIGKPMKSLWSPGKHPEHCVHALDIAGAMWACARWMESLGRKEADILAGEEISFHYDKLKIKDIVGAPAPDAKVIAPLFNIVDDTQNTLVNGLNVVCSAVGAHFEFFNLVQTTFLKLVDVEEEINEHHVGPWMEMLRNSDPPITNTPLSAYMDDYALSKRVYGADNTKVKEIVGYKLQRPVINKEYVIELIDKWKEEKMWPNVKPKGP